MSYKRNNRNHNYNEKRRDRGERHERSSRNEHKNYISQKEIQENENAIKAFKAKIPVCEICGKPIVDVADAISNRGTESPVHFDCVLEQINSGEKLGPNEKVTYIGQGKFAVLYFENPHDLRKFTIRRTIDWENLEKRSDWRIEMAGLYSQVK